MVRKQWTPQIWRDSYRLTDNNQGRFTAYGIILALGVLAALATALDLPALGNANRGALELVSVPDEATAAPLVPLPKIDVETEEWSEPELATSPPAEPEPVINQRHLTVRRGDTLMHVLRRAGAKHDEAHTAISALKTIFDPRKLRAGQKMTAAFRRGLEPDYDADKSDALVSVVIALDVEQSVSATLTNDGFQAQEITQTLEPSFVRGTDRINESLFVSARRAGVPARVIMDLIRMFSWDVDFQREIRRGDRFEILFESFKDEDGLVVKNGDILYASLVLSGENLQLYRFGSEGDAVDYYDAKGQSARKALMKTPIDGARLSSRFGKRRHPILGYTMMHRGLDFAAPRGTPIMAAGDGVVERAGRYGAYGKYVRIRHNSTYKTAYAHLKGYAKGIRSGKRVRQGQIIGYVGTTGRSTGPHLHYEVHRNGEKLNPLKLKLPTGKKLKGTDLVSFLEEKAKIEVALRETPASSSVASAKQ
jgi:murein DD-endopeptidase MepM/ murein hydrolase activator NlpD